MGVSDNNHQEFKTIIMKSTLALALLILSVNLAHSQESKKYLKLKQDYNYREGYILDKDSMKVNGLIKAHMMNEAKKYSIVTFVQTDGTKKKYYPSGIKGFGYSIYEFVSDNSSFYEVVSKGRKVSLYKNLSVSSWSSPGAPGMAPVTYSSTIEDLYVKRDNETTFKLVRKKNFAVEFSEYFKDCEEIVNKIIAKEYTHKDIERIVSKYNHCK